MRIRTRVMAAAFGTALMVVGVSAPAGAGVVSPTPNEHLVLSFTSFGANGLSGHATATGVVDGTGTVTAGDGRVFPAVVTLPEGKLKLRVVSGPGGEIDNPATCAAAFNGTDTLKVTGGTGVFKGATGSGSDTVVGAIIFPKKANGQCNFDAAPTTVGITVFADLNLHLAS